MASERSKRAACGRPRVSVSVRVEVSMRMIVGERRSERVSGGGSESFSSCPSPNTIGSDLRRIPGHHDERACS